MKTFSQRYGYTEKPGVQFERMSEGLRNRLWNKFYTDEFRENTFSSTFISLTYIEKVLDRFGLTYQLPTGSFESTANLSSLKKYLFDNTKWYLMYDCLEIYVSMLDKSWKRERCKEYNKILEEEASGYRFVNGFITPITNEQEIKTIEKATKTKYSTVNTHIEKATKLLSNKKNHDYENAIKESISAVESICCIITGSDKSTLGQALDKLEEKGVHLHKALKSSMSSLYGYTSDEGGIRHGKIDFAGARIEDAKYMLVSCSAFVNYLIEKWEKAQ